MESSDSTTRFSLLRTAACLAPLFLMVVATTVLVATASNLTSANPGFRLGIDPTIAIIWASLVLVFGTLSLAGVAKANYMLCALTVLAVVLRVSKSGLELFVSRFDVNIFNIIMLILWLALAYLFWRFARRPTQGRGPFALPVSRRDSHDYT